MAKLIYLMGASGSGKDTLLNYLKAHNIKDLEHKQLKTRKNPPTTINPPHSIFTDNKQKIIVAHRYITHNQESCDESHIFLYENDFQFRLENSFFVMAWKSNNLKYAVGREVYHWVNGGHNVIVNGSRAYLPVAKKIFGDSLIPICLNVPEAILVERLLSNGHASQRVIEQRLSQARTYANGLPNYTHFIDNDCDIKTLAIRLYQILNTVDDESANFRLYEELSD
ncbi:AAA family ATPase [Thorsellia anophelis]|uniref:Ribose 1,5-bisphosphokinase n=1 Tax=Thorsellia anophelis DSM 18579 TaxID=1123402 RepID=A0A1H9YFC8_9GAMM|nr:AAA family ATPase [Thorsellia anophelis]SES67677.1 ribose 1,5-bisphosphokinase [Thorsellia anophelis DSM 18579]